MTTGTRSRSVAVDAWEVLDRPSETRRDAHHVAWTVVDTPAPKIAYGEVRLFKYDLGRPRG
jgi:hypothetical protein